MTYWEQRRSQLMSQLEKDEAKLKQKLSDYYDLETKKYEKEIASYYQLYGEDNVIEYRKLMLSLSDEDKALLIEDMNEFAEKYPQYQHLMPVRESVYKLNRLEGLQMSTRMQQLRLGAIDNMALENHLRKQAERSVDAIAKELGFGEEFYSMNPNIVETVINQQWADGKNFSERIWNNREKLANYLNDDFAKGIARGDSYEKLIKSLRQRFDNVSRNDMYRLIYTEGTFVMNESMIKPFEEDFEEYEFSIADSRACGVCTALNGQKFRMQDRQPGVNFAPMHAYCRCSFTVVIPDNFVEKYEQKYNRKTPKIVDKSGGSGIIKTKEEAYDYLNSVFGSVEKSISKLDEHLVVENTEQLRKLNERFGILTNDNIGYISGSRIKAAAETYSSLTEHKYNLTLSSKYYKAADTLLETEKYWQKINFSMPVSDEYLSVATVTHEYGHMLQNELIRNRINPAIFEQYNLLRLAGNRNGAMHLLHQEEKEQAKNMYGEIIGIVKERNPDIKISEQISKYGKSSYYEAFAEIFMNSQCGEPNELGKAMNIFLERSGYV